MITKNHLINRISSFELEEKKIGLELKEIQAMKKECLWWLKFYETEERNLKELAEGELRK